jgi:hypothetical protein
MKLNNFLVAVLSLLLFFSVNIIAQEEEQVEEQTEEPLEAEEVAKNEMNGQSQKPA